MMPSSWVIEFEGVGARDVRASGMHRFLSAWFGDDEESHKDPKGYSLGPREDHEGGLAAVVHCVADPLAALLAELPEGQAVQFGHTYPKAARVRRCHRTAAASWDDLATYQGTTQWQLELLSPLTLRRHGVDQPWPAPRAILQGLAAKWTTWNKSQPIVIPDAYGDSILVTGVELAMEQSVEAPVPCWGAVGRVEWTWDGADRRSPHDGAAVVERLLRLAEFSGMGAYPQHGLGRVRVSGRRAPGPPRRP